MKKSHRSVESTSRFLRIGLFALVCAGIWGGLPRMAAAVCGNGVLEGGEECDPGGPTYDGHGDPAAGPCNQGEICYFAFTCCKFNCQFTGQGGPCTDGNPCTSPDLCNNVGVCVGGGATPGSCDDNDACTYNDTCNGTVCAGTSVSCVADQCNTRTCNGTSSCTTTPLTGQSCNDGNACTFGETCSSGGVCTGGTTVTCTSDECATRTCNGTSTCTTTPNTGQPCSDDSNPCTVDACNNAGTCAHTAGNAGTVCRPAAGVCDKAETCTGGSTTCPADAKLTTTCRPSAGVCDAAENCNGTSNDCPADGFASSATSCTGTSQGGTCDNDSADHCSGTSNSCFDAFKTSSTVCRASAGQCDVAENCTGSSGACPADSFKSSAANCTGASQGGACDNDSADHCSGTSNLCFDAFKTSSTVCRASAGQCDVAENCTGSSGACPANAFASSATSCTGTSQGGACDGADHCLGTSNSCVDVFLSSSTVCRASAGQCDPAEQCTGTSGACPPNAFASSASVCRIAAGECDLTENCPGSGPNCPADAKKVSGTPCTDDGNQCTEDQCNGTAASCAHPNKSNDTTCDDGNACTQTDNCDGHGQCVGGDLVQCTADQCQIAGTCNPNTGTCSDPTNKPDGTICEDGSLCTTGEKCKDGTCGAPTFVKTCPPAIDECHEDGACDPATGACFFPNKPNGTACGDPFSCVLDGNCELGNCVGGRLGDDFDRDGVCDFIDNCDGTANPDQADDDGDAIGNLCDNCPENYNPNQNNLCGLPSGAAHLPSLFLKQVKLTASTRKRTMVIKGILDTTEAGGIGGLDEGLVSGALQPSSPQNTGFSVNLTGSSLTMPGEIMIFPPCPTATTCLGTRGEIATFRLKRRTNLVVLTIKAANRLFAAPFSDDPVKVTLAYGAPDANDTFHFDRRDQIPAPAGSTTLGKCVVRSKGRVLSCRK